MFFLERFSRKYRGNWLPYKRGVTVATDYRGSVNVHNAVVSDC